MVYGVKDGVKESRSLENRGACFSAMESKRFDRPSPFEDSNWSTIFVEERNVFFILTC